MITATPHNRIPTPHLFKGPAPLGAAMPHAFDDEHQPQPASCVHLLHVPRAEQPRLALQPPTPKRQSKNDPTAHGLLGADEPNAVPSLHVDAIWHHPHRTSDVHVSQPMYREQRFSGHIAAEVTHGHDAATRLVLPGGEMTGHSAAATVALVRSAMRLHDRVESHHAQSGRPTHVEHDDSVEHSAGHVNDTVSGVGDDGVSADALPLPTTNTEVAPRGHVAPPVAAGPSDEPCTHVDSWEHQPHCRAVMHVPQRDDRDATLQSVVGMAMGDAKPSGATPVIPIALSW